MGLRNLERVLDVGCGSGVITGELAGRARRGAVGVDRREGILRAARGRDSGASFVAADAANLPFGGGTFDAVVASFTLMWLGDPGGFLKEALRVVVPGGLFVAMAEADYAGAVDYPGEASTRDAAAAAVRAWGGDPEAGRKLPGWLAEAGFELTRFGVLNSVWPPRRWAEEEARELELLRRLVAPVMEGNEIESAARGRQAAIAAGTRCYFLPIFFATARNVG